MSLAEVEREALALPETERASLAVSLLRTLTPADPGPSDEDVFQRDAELENGSAEELSHEEFIQRVGRERGR